MDYRKCFVPSCSNDSANSSGKIFVKIREDLRKQWCSEARVDYSSKSTMYCCEDHFNPLSDLKNYHKTKLMNQEPILKATAVLRNLVKPMEELPRDTLQETELGKLLLLPEQLTPTSAKKRKIHYGETPSTSSAPTLPLKVQIGIQCKPVMVDKSTNYKTRKPTVTGTAIFEVHSSQETSSANPSLFGYTSETEETTTEKGIMKAQVIRQNILEIIYKKPKMYLGLPKQYLWLIDYLVEKSMPQMDSLCLIATLLKIKQNDTIERISDQLEISRTKLSIVILQGIEALANFFQNLIVNPEPKQIKNNLPLVFKIRYSNVEVIIDCFEIQICKPSDPLTQAQTWSQYKNCNTVKYLIGCTPNGLVSFISKGFGGRISDKAIVEKSNFLDTLHPNSVVLADRGFKEIDSLLSPLGIKLLRPPSVYSGVKQSVTEAIQSKVIASLRVHVERVIRRVREFAILKPHSVVHYKYVPYLDEIVIIACGLINLQDEIIKSL